MRISLRPQNYKNPRKGLIRRSSVSPKQNDVNSFIRKSRGKFDLISYKKVKYISQNIPVKLECEYHGLFQRTPKEHLESLYRCPLCRNVEQTEELIMEYEQANPVHKFDFTDTIVTDLDSNCVIKCKKCKTKLSVSWSDFVDFGCPKCSKNVDIYDYEKNIDSSDSEEPVILITDKGDILLS